MNEEELDLDSDSGDEDYKPTGAENDLSEEESGNESEEPCSDSEKSNIVKKRKINSKGRTRKKLRNGKTKGDEVKEEEKENSEVVLTEEEKKKKSDLLWADFLSDCGPPAKKTQPVKQDIPSEVSSDIKSPSNNETDRKPKQEPQITTQILTFAGEEVKIEKPVTPESNSSKKSRGSGGLSSVLSLIGKKGKMSTLEKSKLDWERFKDEQGIKEDIETYNKGKNGYLEKQDFLQRADVRQFEIEKSMRANRRSLNR